MDATREDAQWCCDGCCVDVRGASTCHDSVLDAGLRPSTSPADEEHVTMRPSTRKEGLPEFEAALLPVVARHCASR